MNEIVCVNFIQELFGYIRQLQMQVESFDKEAQYAQLELIECGRIADLTKPVNFIYTPNFSSDSVVFAVDNLRMKYDELLKNINSEKAQNDLPSDS